MALTYLLPLSFPSCSSIYNAPPSSSRLLTGASSTEFSSARNALSLYRTSLLARAGGIRSPLTNPKTEWSGCGEASKFWSDRARPKSYGVAAYSAEFSARVAAVEATEPSTGLVEEVINAEERREEEPALGGGEGTDGGDRGGGGGGGGDGGGDEEDDAGKKMSMSQKLTLVYAALVGVGGLMGFAKSGSNKSLITGGGAALALFLVYAQLPIRPTFASSVGLGISAVLLGVMYPRFKNSGKFMPAGLVSLVSLIMTGGYLHGIVRTAH